MPKYSLDIVTDIYSGLVDIQNYFQKFFELHGIFFRVKLNNAKITNIQGKLLEAIPGTISRLFKEYFETTTDLTFTCGDIVVAAEERIFTEVPIGHYTCKISTGGATSTISPKYITFASGSIHQIARLRDFLKTILKHGRVGLLPESVL